MSVTARATRTSVSRLRGPTIAVLRGCGCPHRCGRPFNWREGKRELKRRAVALWLIMTGAECGRRALHHLPSDRAHTQLNAYIGSPI
jgi:hypothetical protein